MIKLLANKYYELRYGKTYAPKPILGPYDSIAKKIKMILWRFDCFLDGKYRQEAKKRWIESF